jgi:iron complex transport system ATP-binding protein
VNTPSLQLTSVTKSFGAVRALKGVSFDLRGGEVHALLGENGAGKSTLIKVLARLLRPQTGTVEYEGADVSQTSEAELAKRRAVLSQAIEIAFPLTVREVVMMGRYPHFSGRPGPTDERIVDEVMKHFDVVEFKDRYYQTLSGGERQRVNFARVLAQLWREDVVDSSRYLFLDEPLTFLDIRHQIDFMKRIRSFTDAAEVVTIGVVHDLNLAARFADQILMLDGGRIVAYGTPSEALTTERIQHVFGVEPTMVQTPDSGIYLVFN